MRNVLTRVIGLARDGRYFLRPRILVPSISLARISLFRLIQGFSSPIDGWLSQSVQENADVFEEKFLMQTNPEKPITFSRQRMDVRDR